ncbi:transcription initiation factor iiic tfiiic polypeptide 3-related [Anaeramoeba flamelloides]|uniref:Transcription initiation factor iiic tfiiic polypeptide 3-related n=1 Tax=Anaeramoeba flamelloides TaxID=1746091 RepID=A0AAV7YGY1_9EUKA|nr:transcription initiation factor iiic tfiiic polypeptide 3-related [Anaeramoeba flamelloides]
MDETVFSGSSGSESEYESSNDEQLFLEMIDDELDLEYIGKKKRIQSITSGNLQNEVSPYIESLLGEATMCIVRKDYNHAIELLKEVIKKNPNFGEPYKTLSVIYQNRGKIELAFEYLSKALTLKTYKITSEEFLEGANFARQLKKQDDELYYLSRAITKDPKNLELLQRRYKLHLQLNKKQQACKDLEKMIEIDPNNFKIRDELFNEYFSYLPKCAEQLDELLSNHYKKMSISREWKLDIIDRYTQLLIWQNKILRAQNIISKVKHLTDPNYEHNLVNEEQEQEIEIDIEIEHENENENGNEIEIEKEEKEEEKGKEEEKDENENEEKEENANESNLISEEKKEEIRIGIILWEGICHIYNKDFELANQCWEKVNLWKLTTTQTTNTTNTATIPEYRILEIGKAYFNIKEYHLASEILNRLSVLPLSIFYQGVCYKLQGEILNAIERFESLATIEIQSFDDFFAQFFGLSEVIEIYKRTSKVPISTRQERIDILRDNIQEMRLKYPVWLRTLSKFSYYDFQDDDDDDDDEDDENEEVFDFYSMNDYTLDSNTNEIKKNEESNSTLNNQKKKVRHWRRERAIKLFTVNDECATIILKLYQSTDSTNETTGTDTNTNKDDEMEIQNNESEITKAIKNKKKKKSVKVLCWDAIQFQNRATELFVNGQYDVFVEEIYPIVFYSLDIQTSALQIEWKPHKIKGKFKGIDQKRVKSINIEPMKASKKIIKKKTVINEDSKIKNGENENQIEKENQNQNEIKVEREREREREKEIKNIYNYDFDSDSGELPLSLSNIMEYNKYLKLIVLCTRALLLTKNIDRAKSIINLLLIDLRFIAPQEYRNTLIQFSTKFAIKVKDFDAAFVIFRKALGFYVYNPEYWNYLSQILRYCQRFMNISPFYTKKLKKYPKVVPIKILLANVDFANKRYSDAISRFLSVLYQRENDPYLHLIVGVSYLNLCFSSYNRTRNLDCIRSLAFLLKYKKLRKNKLETHYNMARAFHKLGYPTHAMIWYQKVLKMPKSDGVDFHYLAAWNLSLIYRKSKNHVLSAQIIKQYCRI